MTNRMSCPQLLSMGALGVCVSFCAEAELLKDSTVTLMSRNFYLDRDYKGATPYAEAREWAQGFILKAHSGFTEGPIGLGLDLTGMLGLKLDSSPDRTATQLLAFNPQTRQARDEYSELGAALKARVSKTQLSVGTQFPNLPVLTGSPARLFPQTFRGAYLQSGDIKDLSLHLGRMDRVNMRDSTDYQPISIASPNGRFRPGASSQEFDFIAGDYKWSDALTLRYNHAKLDNIYQQHFWGLLHTLPIGPGLLKTDLRIFDSREDGRAESGRVDNRSTGVMFTYQMGAHSFGLGHMRQTGDTAMVYLAGGEPNVLSDGTMSADFVNPKEQTWALRYDYDFAGLGIPGLRAMARYLHGSHINLPALGGDDLSESSKDFELSYAVQSGPVKGLALRLRQNFYRSDLSSAATFRSDNETRVNIDYTWKLW